DRDPAWGGPDLPRVHDRNWEQVVLVLELSLAFRWLSRWIAPKPAGRHSRPRRRPHAGRSPRSRRLPGLLPQEHRQWLGLLLRQQQQLLSGGPESGLVPAQVPDREPQRP